MCCGSNTECVTVLFLNCTAERRSSLDDLYALPDVCSSRQASPALRRLCLTWLFILLVLRPELEACDPWSDCGFEPMHVATCLEGLINDNITQLTVNSMFQSNFVVTLTQRMSYAMMISLYAVSSWQRTPDAFRPRIQPQQCAGYAGKNASQEQDPSFEPETSASLLALMDIIMSTSDSDYSLYFRSPDPAQGVLLKWGCTVPWAWSTWSDPSIPQYDVIEQLVSP